MGPFCKTLLFLLVLMATYDPATSTNSTTETSSEEEPKRSPDGLFLFTVHMLIVNKLGHGTPLTLHCKSKNDDLQVHVIQYDQSFRWKFRPNFWGTTLFYCYFWWSGGRGAYDIYKDRRDHDRCTHNCDWYVTKEGVEGYTEENKNYGKKRRRDILFKWDDTDKLTKGGEV
ncbi:Plant self-incompatibility S1 [Vigna unguiculata]|uniref:S-protein homolog n=1 Tax=Vigna unguiculata TaxID=3917 RepID=A0A4D6LC88_VIGUN|nr:Plant self-incompatibility S1 [Vigna unguiculata]